MATPIELIQQMRQRGYNNNQIIQYLQGQGFRSHQIFDALNQVDIKTAGPVTPSQAAVEPAPLEQQIPPMQAAPMPGMPAAAPSAQVDEEKIEEIAESIIEEKWTDLINNVNKIIDWKDKTESRIVKIEADFDNLKHGFDELHKGVLGKISEYEKGISDVGTEVKALEKVFQKILPTLTENVNELSRITGDLKKKKA